MTLPSWGALERDGRVVHEFAVAMDRRTGFLLPPYAAHHDNAYVVQQWTYTVDASARTPGPYVVRWGPVATDVTVP